MWWSDKARAVSVKTRDGRLRDGRTRPSERILFPSFSRNVLRLLSINLISPVDKDARTGQKRKGALQSREDGECV